MIKTEESTLIAYHNYPCWQESGLYKVRRHAVGRTSCLIRARHCKIWFRRHRGEWNFLCSERQATVQGISVQIPNAGINESEEVCWGNLKFVDGKPARPELLTLKVNMTGVIYSEQLPRRLYKDPLLDHLFGSRSPWDVLHEA